MIAPLLPGCCMVKWAPGGASAPWYLPNEKGRSESGIIAGQPAPARRRWCLGGADTSAVLNQPAPAAAEVRWRGHHQLVPATPPHCPARGCTAACAHGMKVVMDNVSVHRVEGVREAIEVASATLRYLPPSSPDLNPIELSYSAFKAFLRKCAERTEEALRRRIGQFVWRLPAEACANFFAHAGYAAT